MLPSLLREIGIQRSALSHVMSGRNNPSLDFMLKIKSRFPEVNLDWLLLGNGEMIIRDPQLEEMENITQTNKVNQPEVTNQYGKRRQTPPIQDEEITGILSQGSQKVLPPISGQELYQIVLLYKDGTFSTFEPK